MDLGLPATDQLKTTYDSLDLRAVQIQLCPPI